MKFRLYKIVMIIAFLYQLFGCLSKKNYVNKNLSDSYFYTSSKNEIYFLSGGNSMAFLKIYLKDADIESFEVLSRYFAKDKNRVYYQGYAQKHIDQASFIFKNNVPVDKNNVYKEYSGVKQVGVINNADPATFEYIDTTSNRTWARDKNFYFFRGQLISCDRGTFEFLNNKFCKDKYLLYAELIDRVEPIPTQSDQVVVLSNYFVRDGSFVYYVPRFKDHEYVKINFDNKDSIKIYNDFVVKIDDNIYWDGYLFNDVNVDAGSFQMIDEHYYSKDNNNVYFNQQKINDADVKSFEHVDGHFSKDKNAVYYQTKRIPGVHPETFSVVNGVARDGEKIWHASQL